tara:strand:+ start:342 stop:509 length:168 start_codon:yes stop_codon:yes gene_type:complete
MKYFKHMLEGAVANYQPEGTNKFIPPVSGNTDYSKMLEEVEAGTSTIEEVDDTPE